MSKNVTAEMVKELRERTGVGMAKCKEALDCVHGDMEKAIDYLRKAGIASAVKKEGRDTKEGSIGIGESDCALALIELTAETDFVTQNERFKAFLSELAEQVAQTQPKDIAALMNQPLRQDPSITVDEKRALMIQSLGENIQVKRMHLFLKSSDISLGYYSHMKGKIVAVVELAGGGGCEVLAREIAMHIAAEAPEYVRPEEVPSTILQREEEIARSQIGDKPPQVAQKILEGKVKAFYDQTCLLCQKYIKDTAKSIAVLLQEEGKRMHRTLDIRAFVRWKAGG